MKTNSAPATGVASVIIKKKSRWRRLFHSKWFYFLLILVAAGIFYYYRQANNTKAETRYILSAAATSTVINTISGTGEVSASNQINIIPQVSGDILELNIKTGQKVKAGDIIAKLDDTDARAQVNKAKNSLDSARASLNAKLAGPSSEEIAVAQKSVDSAKLSYDDSERNLKYVKSQIADNLTKAQMTVDNAALNLQNAQRSYDDAVSSSGISATGDNQDLDKAYNDAKSTLASAQVSLRSALVAADNILEKNNYNSSSHNYKNYLGARDQQALNETNNDYDLARASFTDLEQEYSAASLAWNHDNIEKMLTDTKVSAQKMQTLARALSSLLNSSISASDFSQSILDGYKQTASSQESSLISQMNSLQSASQAIANAKLNSSSSNLSSSSSVKKAASDLETSKNNLTSAENSLKQTKTDNQKSLDSANTDLASRKNSYESAQAQLALKIAKPRSVDLASYYLQIQSAEDSYKTAAEDAAKAEIKAPIDGIIAQVDKKAGDSVRDSDAGDTLATIITEEKMATISLNEVDAAKVAVGQKATLTFSALTDLSITGTVVEVESIGTITQGVVSYNTKIVLDTQDERIKPQMTVSADIVVDKSVDVLTVPNAAVKTDSSGANYVEVLDYTGGEPDASGVAASAQPTTTYVEVGLSDDTNTEIKSGLTAGVYVVTRTVTASTAASTASAKSATSLLSGSSTKKSSGFGAMSAGGPPGM